MKCGKLLMMIWNSQWRLNLDNEITEDEEKIANAFNDFLIKKIENLKNGINKNDIKDPLLKLKEKVNEKNLSFKLKAISKNTLLKAMKKIKNKKSVGCDGLSQEQMVMGTNSLSDPLLDIIIK